MRTLLLAFLLVSLMSSMNGQSSGEIRESFEEGLFFFNRGDYSEAVYYFKKLVESDPENAHFNFLLGESYMNMPGNESLAIPYFEKATVRTVAKGKYRSRDFDEINAPLHAWFYLGNVYRMDNKLDDALKAYDTFVKSPFYYGNYNVNIVENEIKSCERAKIIFDSPVEVDEQLLDTLINSTAAELRPVASRDGHYLVFLRRLKFYDAIMFTARNGETWSQPLNLNPLVGSDGDFYPVCLSDDGKELYLVKKNPDNSDIYVAYRTDATWSKAIPLSKHINSKAHETSAGISSDRQMLWFTSARKGGSGGLDIYFSQRDADGGWGRARNAGKVINTLFDEESPSPVNNGKALYFSSKGHYSMGGYDIFYATQHGKTWNDPVNIGYPVNNTTDNFGFVPLDDGISGYYSKINIPGGTAEDIFRVTLKSMIQVP